MAGSISNPTAGFFDGGFTNSGVTQSITEGTACFGGFCPGEAVPGPGPNYNVSDPLSMRITSFQVQCRALGECAVYVEADFSYFATTAGQYSAVLSIDGTAGYGVNFDYGASLFNQNTFDVVFGNQTVAIPLGNSSSPTDTTAFSDSFTLGTINVNPGDRILATIFLSDPDLFALRIINLPDSLTLTLVDTAVPEPATLGLMAAALAALVIGRKRL